MRHFLTNLTMRLRRIIRRLRLRDLMIAGVTAALVAGVGGLALRAALNDASSGEGLIANVAEVERTGQGGGGFDVYVTEDRTPLTAAAARDAAALEILPGRLDGRVPTTVIDAARQRDILRTVTRFLPLWESTDPSQDPAAYREALRPLTAELGRGRIVARSDATLPPQVGPCEECTAGSAWVRGVSPRDYFAVHRDDGERVWVSTQGMITVVGDESVYSGVRLRRQYGLVLARDPQGQWRIERAAAETLAEGER